MNSFGFFQEYYTREYLAGHSPSIIAFIGSLQLGLMYIASPCVGALFDAFGPKGVLFGIAVAFGIQVALSTAGRHFKQNRGLAMGFVAAGSSAGGVCFPIMLSHLVPRTGFGWAMRITALILLGGYAIAMCLTPTIEEHTLPKAAGKVFDFGGFRDKRYATIALASVVGNLGLYAPYYYAGTYVSMCVHSEEPPSDHHLEPLFALQNPKNPIGSYLLPILNRGSFFGRVIGGLVADRMGGLNLLVPSTISCGVFCLTLWLLSNSVAMTVAFVCIYGMLSGIFISVMSPVIARLSPDAKMGSRLGAFYSLSALGVFTGTPIGGAFIQGGTEGEYRNMITYAGATIGSAGVILLIGRFLCDRNMMKRW
ncbi:hypothetical protein ACJ41O_006284 [Fusarium nematophilum]